MKDESEVELRIKSAQGAFSAIRTQFFSAKGIKNSHKKTAYEGLILSILLFGCESWSLPKLLLNRLQLFHNRCVRAMCKVSMWHVREYRITQANLESRLQLEPFKFEFYLARRRLRWAGHVSSTQLTRPPRMFLSFWVDNKRPQQRPQFNYGHGHGLGRDLRNAGIHLDNWASLASDRNIWHTITQQNNVYCNTNSGGYIWVDPEQLSQAAAENTLPSLLSYAGVLLGLLSLPDAPTPVVPTIPSPAKSNLTNPQLPQPTAVTQLPLSPPSSSHILALLKNSIEAGNLHHNV
jgi:hypothetical protein